MEDIPTPLFKHTIGVTFPLKGDFALFFFPADKVIDAYIEILSQRNQRLIGWFCFASLIAPHRIGRESAQFGYIASASLLFLSQSLQPLRKLLYCRIVYALTKNLRISLVHTLTPFHPTG